MGTVCSGKQFAFLHLCCCCCWLCFFVLNIQSLEAMADTQLEVNEGIALLAIKANLVDPEGHLNDWIPTSNSTHPYCSWTGITCTSSTSLINDSSSVIISLNLSSMNLTGSLSSDLAQLKNLVNISVDSNNFTGDLPAEIVSLPFLQFLNISNNNFSNYFPSNFSHLQYLQVNVMFPAHSVCQLLWLFLVRLLVVGKAQVEGIIRIRVPPKVAVAKVVPTFWLHPHPRSSPSIKQLPLLIELYSQTFENLFLLKSVRSLWCSQGNLTFLRCAPNTL